ncbi:MAG: beta-lactamase family protein [Theionarchaea archaeon]|nr:MAG: hypothetical protein AYK18_05270 [Theionarchaea archaeon DG-70]MBU7011076.1 beta-lactamase family protein [Theionarchaea archaeon]
MNNSNKLKNELQQYLDQLIRETKNIYNAVLLVETPDLKWKGASGMANPEEGLTMVADDQFYTASTAKMLTATLVMDLVEKEQVSLDDKIHQYLPESLMSGLHEYNNQSYGDTLAIRQLLNHTSGLGDNWSDINFIQLILTDTDKLWEPEETIAYVKMHCPPQFAPAQGFHYSDINYNLAGLIIQEITGKKLHEVYREMLLDPLGMNHTYRPFREDPRPSIAGRAPSCSYMGDINYTFYRSLSADWAGGGLQSTTEDLNRFLRAFFRNEILNPSTRNEMAQWVNVSESLYYGLGIVRCVLDEAGDPDLVGLGEILGHQGASGSFMYYWLDKDTTICGTMNQAENESKIGEIVANILKILSNYV